MVSNQDKLVKLFFEHVAQTSENPLSLNIEKANNIYLYSNNKKYVDFISGIAVSSCGHQNEEIKQAIKNQIDNYSYLMVYGEMIMSPQVLLAKKLDELLPSNLNQTYFVNSGSEAIEGALKLAKKQTKRHQIVALKSAYHGSTHGALSLMSNEYFSNSFVPLLPGISFMNQNNYDDLKLINYKTAAVVMEPIMGEKGYLPCELNFIKEIRKKCDEVGALLIFDEIQSGLGRSGKWFAFEHYETVPDILVLAKSLGAGLPLGCFTSSKEIMSNLKNNPVLGHITTQGGNPVCCAAGLAGINFLEKNELINQVTEKENLIRNTLKHKDILGISGKGLMLALEFESIEKAQCVIKNCIENGLLTDWFLYAENKLRICPPLIINETQIKEACEIILKSFEN